MLILDLPEDVYNRLQILSMRTGRTMVYYALEALLEHLDDIEAQNATIQEASVEFDKEGQTDAEPD